MNLKRITLYSPAVRNNGEYVDAGQTLDVGEDPEMIDAARAKTMIDGSLAVSETAAKADEKAGNDAVLELDKPLDPLTA